MNIFDLFNLEEEVVEKKTFEPKDIVGESGYIEISPALFKAMNKSLEKSEITSLIVKALMDYDLGPPYKVFSESAIWEDFEKLRNRDFSFIIAKEFWNLSREIKGVPEHTYLGKHIYIKRNIIGLNTSDYFSQKVRWRATCRNKPKNIETLWGYHSQLANTFNAIWGMKYDRVNRSILRSCLRNRQFIASQFRPSTAKSLINSFQAKKVLDPSAGWGDRLSGFLASDAEHYVGIDPNSSMHPCYQKQFEFYNRAVNKKAEFICSGSENADLSEYKEYFDLVLTSPPYFDTERYTDEETQSIVKHSNFDNWMKGYFFPTLDKCWDSLAEGGRIILNINDINDWINKKQHYLCKPMIDYMTSKEGCSYEGILGYGLAKSQTQRDNGRFMIENQIGEPMFVFAKGDAKPPLFLQESLFFD